MNQSTGVMALGQEHAGRPAPDHYKNHYSASAGNLR